MATVSARSGSGHPARAIEVVRAFTAACPRYLPSLTQFVLRLTVALPFWKSGLTKWDGFFELSAGARWLFQNEFKLHILGSQYPMPLPLVSAYASSIAEILLPIMLVLGLGTRFAALGLLVMTGVIQLTIPDAWQTHHLPWAAMLLAVLCWGPGRLALDHWVASRFRMT